MSETTPLTMPAMIGAAVRQFGDRDALGFVGGTPETYLQLAAGIDAVAALLQRAGIGRGDRVAILGHNMPNWAKAYFGTTFLGAVAVPLLPDFHVSEIDNILRHAEPGALFVSASLEGRLKELDTASPGLVVRLDDLQVIRAREPGLAFDPEARPRRPVAERASHHTISHAGLVVEEIFRSPVKSHLHTAAFYSSMSFPNLAHASLK